MLAPIFLKRMYTVLYLMQVR